MKNITVPVNDDFILNLEVGEPVMINGLMVTGRDVVHKWMIETFIRKTRKPEGDDMKVYEALRPLLNGGLLYHCGPVVSGVETGDYGFVAAGPTTSIREEPYQAEVLEHFNIRGVIGKGGMGPSTLAACKKVPAVYLHAIGGAGTLIARAVVQVKTVFKLDFGVPEALWVIEVKDFPAVVTMDAKGNSLHADIEEKSGKLLQSLL